MPIDYSRYPPNWKTEIRPRILARAQNKCECCGVRNYEYVFRGYMDELEVYQISNGSIFNASNSELISFEDYFGHIKPLSGNPNQQAIKIVLTIAHLDHDETNHEVSDERLKAMCQRCHLRYDSKEKASRKKQSSTDLFS